MNSTCAKIQKSSIFFLLLFFFNVLSFFVSCNRYYYYTCSYKQTRVTPLNNNKCVHNKRCVCFIWRCFFGHGRINVLKTRAENRVQSSTDWMSNERPTRAGKLDLLSSFFFRPTRIVSYVNTLIWRRKYCKIYVIYIICPRGVIFFLRSHTRF